MNLFYQEPISILYCGHALDLKELPPESVDMCLCSPPYWGLRSYKTEPMIWDSKDGCVHEWVGHNKKWHSGTNAGAIQLGDKGAFHNDFNNMSNFCSLCNAWRGELGLEPTIELYINHLIQIFNEVKRVLKKTGTCWVNIDDSYASGKGTCFNPGGGKGSFSGHGDRKDSGIYPLDRGNISMLRAEGLLPKSLCLIPARFALAMLENGWILRNDIVWNKPNPMPESVKDRFTGSWEHLFFFVKSKRYFFEQQFEQSSPETWGMSKDGNYYGVSQGNPEEFMAQNPSDTKRRIIETMNPLGRNKRDVWEICTVPSPKHKGIRNFATFPEKLCETPILAGCPSMICKKCGKAREKIYRKGFTDHNGDTETSYEKGMAANRLALLRQAARGKGEEYTNDMEVVGYTDCGCNAGFEPGVVLDPFCGSGTALAVAKKLGRKSIGIDISPDYCKLTVKRIQGISLPMELA